MLHTNTGIGKAIEIAGGQSAMARALGIKQQAVQQWYAAGFVPTPRAKQVSELTGVPVVHLLSLEQLTIIRDLSAAL
jgi:DNA-binding transcriptional regulator YdaS (Cro superfamily)